MGIDAMLMIAFYFFIIMMIPYAVAGVLYLVMQISNLIYEISLNLASANLFHMFVGGDPNDNKFTLFFLNSPESVKTFYIVLISLLISLLLGVLLWEIIKKLFSWSIFSSNENSDASSLKGIFKWVGIGLGTLIVVPGIVLILQEVTGIMSQFILNTTRNIRNNLNLSALVGSQVIPIKNAFLIQLTTLQQSIEALHNTTINNTAFNTWIQESGLSTNLTEIDMNIKNLKTQLQKEVSWSDGFLTNKLAIRTAAESLNQSIRNFNFKLSTVIQGFNNETKIENLLFATLIGGNTSTLLWDRGVYADPQFWTSIFNKGSAMVNGDQIKFTIVGDYFGSKSTSPGEIVAGIIASFGHKATLFDIWQLTGKLPVGQTGAMNGNLILNWALTISQNQPISILSLISENAAVVSTKENYLTSEITSETIDDSYNLAFFTTFENIKTYSFSKLTSAVEKQEYLIDQSPWTTFVETFIATPDKVAMQGLPAAVMGVIAILVLFFGMKMFFNFALYGAKRIIQIFWSFILSIGWAFYGWKDDGKEYKEQIKNIFGYIVSILAVLFSIYLFTFVFNLLMTGQLMGLNVHANVFGDVNVFDPSKIEFGLFNMQSWVIILASLIFMIALSTQVTQIPDKVTSLLGIETYSKVVKDMSDTMGSTMKSIAKVASIGAGFSFLGAAGVAKTTSFAMQKSAARKVKSGKDEVKAAKRFERSERLNNHAKRIMGNRMFTSNKTMSGNFFYGAVGFGTGLLATGKNSAIAQMWNERVGKHKKAGMNKDEYKEMKQKQFYKTDENGKPIINKGHGVSYAVLDTEHMPTEVAKDLTQCLGYSVATKGEDKGVLTLKSEKGFEKLWEHSSAFGDQKLDSVLEQRGLVKDGNQIRVQSFDDASKAEFVQFYKDNEEKYKGKFKSPKQERERVMADFEAFVESDDFKKIKGNENSPLPTLLQFKRSNDKELEINYLHEQMCDSENGLFSILASERLTSTKIEEHAAVCEAIDNSKRDVAKECKACGIKKQEYKHIHQEIDKGFGDKRLFAEQWQVNAAKMGKIEKVKNKFKEKEQTKE